MEKDLKWIKKRYGEQMMHLCRELFPKILETEGLLPSLLKEHFPINSHYLAEDIKGNKKIDEFKDYIFSLTDVEKKSQVVEKKTAVELMSDAGYILYPECKTEKDIQSFKKWWKSGEELCTFRGGRLGTCRVWFAVKKNAREIKREDFINPARQDEYGTSVISIQFSRRDVQCLSIKNRYNHSVNNPDNTFNSDLDNIMPGLADAFERDYGVRDRSGRFKSNFELKNYVCVGGKFYHYNHEIGNIYYCDGGVIIDNFQVKRLPPHQMLIDYFIVDFNKKTISVIDKHIRDSFCDSVGEIKQMSFENGILKICEVDGNIIEIGVSGRNEIVSYKNNKLEVMNAKFLMYNKKLKVLDTPNLKLMGDACFSDNEKMKRLNLPQLECMGHGCFSRNKVMSILGLPNLETMGSYCFLNSKTITELNLPKLKTMGNECFSKNEVMVKLNLPELETMGNCCFQNNKTIMEFDLPKLETMGYECFYKNVEMTELNLPELKTMGYGCFYSNEMMLKLFLPKVETMGFCCFLNNIAMRELNLPKLKSMDGGCFKENTAMTELNLPELISMGEWCFYRNTELTELNLPELIIMERHCFNKNKVMSKLDLPELKIMGGSCFEKNKAVTELNLPNLESMGKGCFGLDKSQVNGQTLSSSMKEAIVSRIIRRNEKEQMQ